MRPEFPERAIVTAGMPYANKGLHFGHIGGVFVPADCYARFLRDRIGPENVLFVCGTDCYGSSIDEGYRKLREAGALDGSVLEYVELNHRIQAEALAAYGISLDIFEGSALGRSTDVHELVTREVIERLYANGYLSLDSVAQFYDVEAQVMLNGRQVIGHCPVQGCKSEHAYADECDLGHQYRPAELLNPKSTITETTPELREVKNWYFDLPRMKDLLKEHVLRLEADGITRSVVTDTIAEFLGAPIIYVKQEFFEDYRALEAQLPPHKYRPTEKGKASFELEFADLASRDEARDLLSSRSIRLRTGKTLVPFRITGNVAWGVPAPVLEGMGGLTVWCWPESLWAPISFTRTWLERGGEGVETLNPASRGRVRGTWQDFWCSTGSRVYQFIGQDNIYFYGVAQPALWAAINAQAGAEGPLTTIHEDGSQARAVKPSTAVSEGSSQRANGKPPVAVREAGQLQQSTLVANFHLLFLDKKASSSADTQPPMALDLLERYTPEQLRAHFIALGLSLKAVSFRPKPLDPKADEKAPDPVLRESALLTNVFNRLARSCFYEAQKSFGGLLPLATIPGELIDDATCTIKDFEWAMYRTELHTAFDIASAFIRSANKYWSDAIRKAGDDLEARREVLAAAFRLLRVAMVLMHPIVPGGCELIFRHMGLEASVEEFFSWEHVFKGNEAFFSAEDLTSGGHPLEELPPRFDFFEKHPSQL